MCCDDEGVLDIGALELREDTAVYYGSRFMLCESADRLFAEWIARHAGRDLKDKP